MPRIFRSAPAGVPLMAESLATSRFVISATKASRDVSRVNAERLQPAHQYRRGWAHKTWGMALLAAVFALGSVAHADTKVRMTLATDQGQGDEVGAVIISETEYGLVFTPELKGMAPGIHGFHVHENAKCDPAEKDGKVTPAGAAGGHFDPHKSGEHGFPWGDGHLGDLPALYVDADGEATNPVLAPRLRSLSDISGRSLMIHKGGDNHSDQPKPLGGGAGRVACGVIP